MKRKGEIRTKEEENLTILPVKKSRKELARHDVE